MHICNLTPCVQDSSHSSMAYIFKQHRRHVICLSFLCAFMFPQIIKHFQIVNKKPTVWFLSQLAASKLERTLGSQRSTQHISRVHAWEQILTIFHEEGPPDIQNYMIALNMLKNIRLDNDNLSPMESNPWPCNHENDRPPVWMSW